MFCPTHISVLRYVGIEHHEYCAVAANSQLGERSFLIDAFTVGPILLADPFSPAPAAAHSNREQRIGVAFRPRGECQLGFLCFHEDNGHGGVIDQVGAAVHKIQVTAVAERTAVFTLDGAGFNLRVITAEPAGMTYSS